MDAKQQRNMNVYLRIFDMLDGLLFVEDPVLPGLEAVLHSAQDDLGDLQPGFSQTNCELEITNGNALHRRLEPTVLHLLRRQFDGGHYFKRFLEIRACGISGSRVDNHDALACRLLYLPAVGRQCNSAEVLTHAARGIPERMRTWHVPHNEAENSKNTPAIQTSCS